LPLNDSFSIEAINVAMQVVQNDFDVPQLCKRKTQLEATAKVKQIWRNMPPMMTTYVNDWK
ncbi:GH10938, partial [Drosophila grimshawi]